SSSGRSTTACRSRSGASWAARRANPLHPPVPPSLLPSLRLRRLRRLKLARSRRRRPQTASSPASMDSGDLAPPGLTVPGIGRRVLSMLYESLVVFAIAFFAGFAFYGATQSRLSGDTRLAFQLYLFLVLGA